ncbi:MAG: histone [Candidatus Micrarchaeia archaeon]|jgi:histone H3/H4
MAGCARARMPAARDAAHRTVIYVILPKAPVEKLIREAGARRVSDGAAAELAEVLEKIGTDISVRALRLAKHAGRKTVTAADIKLAKS